MLSFRCCLDLKGIASILRSRWMVTDFEGLNVHVSGLLLVLRLDGGPGTAERSIVYPITRAPSVGRKSSPLSSESVNPSEVYFEETMHALTKALTELEESRRERLTIQCGMARLSYLGPALRVCRRAVAIEERLESMEKRISVMEEAVDAPLPTSSGPPSPAALAQDHPPRSKWLISKDPDVRSGAFQPHGPMADVSAERLNFTCK